MGIISVIMLTYNREDLVSRAIESVLAQTFLDFEFVIVNNGSTDRSGKIADAYSTRDNRVRVIHRQHGNIGSGRNAGLDVALGDYIAFIDDDDWCQPDYLEFLLKLAIENDADIAICGATEKAYNEKFIMTAEEAVIKLLWRKYYNVAFPTKLIRRSLFDNLRFSEESKFDDIELMPRIIAGANKVAYHGLPKYTFYRHEGNNSAWTTDYSLLDAATLDEYLRVYRERTEWLRERFPNNADMWQYFEWSFMISMVEKLHRLEIVGCERQLKDMLNELRISKIEFLNSENVSDIERRWVRKYVIE